MILENYMFSMMMSNKGILQYHTVQFGSQLYVLTSCVAKLGKLLHPTNPSVFTHKMGGFVKLLEL